MTVPERFRRVPHCDWMKNAFLAIILPIATLAGCAVIPQAERSDGFAGIGENTLVGSAKVRPDAVLEDSRCPMNARCIQAGKLVVATRIDGTGWRETVPLTLGEPHATHGTSITLVSGTPERMAGGDGPDRSTHFGYEGGV